MITICYILICRKLKNYLQIFQISFKILEKLPERNSELMGMTKYITYIHKYINEYIDVLGSVHL